MFPFSNLLFSIVLCVRISFWREDVNVGVHMEDVVVRSVYFSHLPPLPQWLQLSPYPFRAKGVIQS